MKTFRDPRHARRILIVQSLFENLFNPNCEISDEMARRIIENSSKIDSLISEHAPEWPISQINKIDLAILRLAIYELAIEPKEPPKVVIDEAVEIAKFLGAEKSPSFVNGVLGAIYKNIEPQPPANPNEKEG